MDGLLDVEAFYLSNDPDHVKKAALINQALLKLILKNHY